MHPDILCLEFAFVLIAALQGTNGKPYINGAWHIDYPGNFTVAGTVFQYQRPRTEGGEVITAMGPTTEPVDIMVTYSVQF